MTCIVAVKANGKVYMGADSCASTGFDYITDIDDKIYRNGDFLIGSAGSVRVKDIIQYGITINEGVEIPNVEKFIRTEFVNALRQALSNGGSLSNHGGEDHSRGAMLVAYKDQCFEIYGDFSVISLKNRKFTAIGSGESFALGSLKTTVNNPSPEDRCIKALEAAEAFQTGVKAPFYVHST